MKTQGPNSIQELEANIASLHRKFAQLRPTDEKHAAKIREIAVEEDKVVFTTQPVVDEHDFLGTGMPQVEAQLDVSVTNMATYVSQWSHFQADILEKL